MYRMLYCRWQNVHMCMCPGFHLGVGGGRARECIPLPWKPVAPLESLFHHYELLINAYNLGSKSIVIYPVNVYFAIWHDMLWFSLTLITWALLYKLIKLVKKAHRCHLTKPKIKASWGAYPKLAFLWSTILLTWCSPNFSILCLWPRLEKCVHVVHLRACMHVCVYLCTCICVVTWSHVFMLA